MVVGFFFFCVVNVWCAANLHDSIPFIWKFHALDDPRILTAGLPVTNDGCEYRCTNDNRCGHMTLNSPLGKVVVDMHHSPCGSFPSYIRIAYSTSKIRTGATVSSFTLGRDGSLGRVSFTPPDAPIFEEGTNVLGLVRPDILWMCEGSAAGARLTQFLFDTAPDKMAFVSADFVIEKLPKVVVSFGEVNNQDWNDRNILREQTFDFSEEAIFDPRDLNE